MDKSRTLYYKYKHRIYCRGGRNKVTPIHTLHTFPPPPPLTAASVSALFVGISDKHLPIENNLYRL
jgi:hypothetical protein